MADQEVVERHHHHHGLTEVLSKFSTAIEQMVTNGQTPPIGPGSIPPVTAESLLVNIAKDFKSQDKRIPEDIGILVSLLQTSINNGLIDDRKDLVRLVSRGEFLTDQAAGGVDCPARCVATHREGPESIDWSLHWNSVEQPAPSTSLISWR